MAGHHQHPVPGVTITILQCKFICTSFLAWTISAENMAPPGGFNLLSLGYRKAGHFKNTRVLFLWPGFCHQASQRDTCLSKEGESWEPGRDLGRVFLPVYNAIVISNAMTPTFDRQLQAESPTFEQKPGEVFSVAGS